MIEARAVDRSAEQRRPGLRSLLESIIQTAIALPGVRSKGQKNLTGATAEQCSFACRGAGSNGKTTFLAIVHEVLGDYAYNASFSMLELTARASFPNDVAALVQHRCLVTGSNEFLTFTPIAKFRLAFNPLRNTASRTLVTALSATTQLGLDYVRVHLARRRWPGFQSTYSGSASFASRTIPSKCSGF